MSFLPSNLFIDVVFAIVVITMIWGSDKPGCGACIFFPLVLPGRSHTSLWCACMHTCILVAHWTSVLTEVCVIVLLAHLLEDVALLVEIHKLWVGCLGFLTVVWTCCLSWHNCQAQIPQLSGLCSAQVRQQEFELVTIILQVRLSKLLCYASVFQAICFLLMLNV